MTAEDPHTTENAVDEQPIDPDQTMPNAASAEAVAEAEPTTAAATADTETAATAVEEEPWWADEGMPWKKEPTKQDYWCLGWFGIIGVVSLVLIPARAWMLPNAPEWFAMITGSRTAVAISGAFAGDGRLEHWLVVVLIASILSLKFDWIYWWAGKLWGRGMIEVWAGQSKRAAKSYARAERWAEKLGALGFFVAYIPIPLPLMQVVFVLAGATNMSLKRFLIYDYLASTAWLVLYFWLGWRFGEPIVGVLDWYAKISLYVALALIVVIVISSVLSSKKKMAAKAAQHTRPAQR